MTPEQIAELRRLAEVVCQKREAHKDALRTYYQGDSQDEAAASACAMASVELQDAIEEHSISLRNLAPALLDALEAGQAPWVLSCCRSPEEHIAHLTAERDDWKHESGLNRTTIANLEAERDALQKWKAEATAVLNDHHAALQRHGRLGESPGGCMDRLAKERDALRAECERLKTGNHAEMRMAAYRHGLAVAAQLGLRQGDDRIKWRLANEAQGQELSATKASLAEAVALLHDVARSLTNPSCCLLPHAPWRTTQRLLGQAPGATMSLPTLLLQLILPFSNDAATIKFGVVGDNQLNAFNTFNTICNRLATENLQVFIGLGDHIQHGGAVPGEWQTAFLGPLTPISHLPRFGCIGNHDDVQGYTQNFWQIPQHPLTSPWGNAIGCWGAVTIGNVRLVLLDTNEAPAIRASLGQGASQAQFLLGELAGTAWSSSRWRVAAFHHPAKTELWDGGCYYPLLTERGWLMDTLAAGGCSFALSGHSHSYQRGSYLGMSFVISGGGGGWLDTTRCWDHPEITVSQAVWHYLTIEAGQETLTVTAKTPQGQQIDQLVIR